MSSGADEPFTLKQTNVSRPHLEHPNLSRQSVVAEEAFQSARSSPRPTSSDSNEALIQTDTRQLFSTPPSSPSSPRLTRNALQNQPVHTASSSQETAKVDTSSGIRFAEGSKIRRKPVGSGSNRNSIIQQGMDSGRITPGLDDSPYIQFAVDQLTRDEEVRGSRVYAYPTEDRDSPEREYQVQPGSPGPESRHRRYESQTSTKQQLPKVATQKPLPGIPDDTPQPEPRRDVLVPWEQEIPPLKFLPGILRPRWLALYIFLILLVNAGLLFSGIYSGLNAGLFDYIAFGDGRYFVFQYLPTLICVPLLIWLFQIQIAIQRIAPFIALASESSNSRTQAPFMEYQPTGFLIPKIFYFKTGQPVLGVVMLIFWLQIFTTPLLSNLYNVYYYGPHNGGQWRWLTVQGVCWTLFALYFLLLVALITLLVWLYDRRTGLKWDPRSLADLIGLLDRANITKDYAHSETFSSPSHFKARLALRSDRLGYWHSSRHPNDVFYGIGEEGASTRRFSLERGQLREKGPERSSFPPETPSTALREEVDLDSEDQFTRVRYRYLPIYLRPIVIILYSLAAILLFIAFIVVSYVNRAVIHGFSPLTPVAPTSAGFSSTNFTFSFIPAVIAQFLWLGWLSIDYAFRRLQPYAAMSEKNKDGAPAFKSLLLDYTARLPISVTLSAILVRHFRIAWFTTMSLIAATIPILAGGCFWAQFYIRDQQVRVAVQTPGYYALCVFLALYAFTLPVIFLNLHKRRLPHKCTTLAENISWLYQSRILGERSQMGSKYEIVTRLLNPATEREANLTGGSGYGGGEGRYVFGRFIGRDGNPHLGVERIGRTGRVKLGSGDRSTKEKPTTIDERLFSGTALGTQVTQPPPAVLAADSQLQERALMRSSQPYTTTQPPSNGMERTTSLKARHDTLLGGRTATSSKYTESKVSTLRDGPDAEHPLLAGPAPLGQRQSEDRYSGGERPSYAETPPRIASPEPDRPLSLLVEDALRESHEEQRIAHATYIAGQRDTVVSDISTLEPTTPGLAELAAGLRDTTTTASSSNEGNGNGNSSSNDRSNSDEEARIAISTSMASKPSRWDRPPGPSNY